MDKLWDDFRNELFGCHTTAEEVICREKYHTLILQESAREIANFEKHPLADLILEKIEELGKQVSHSPAKFWLKLLGNERPGQVIDLSGINDVKTAYNLLQEIAMTTQSSWQLYDEKDVISSFYYGAPFGIPMLYPVEEATND